MNKFADYYFFIFMMLGLAIMGVGALVLGTIYLVINDPKVLIALGYPASCFSLSGILVYLLYRKDKKEEAKE